MLNAFAASTRVNANFTGFGCVGGGGAAGKGTVCAVATAAAVATSSAVNCPTDNVGTFKRICSNSSGSAARNRTTLLVQIAVRIVTTLYNFPENPGAKVQKCVRSRRRRWRHLSGSVIRRSGGGQGHRDYVVGHRIRLTNRGDLAGVKGDLVCHARGVFVVEGVVDRIN